MLHFTRTIISLLLTGGLLATAVNPVYAAKTGGFTIVVLGSSTAWGANASPISLSWANRFATYLQGFDSTNRVINLAISGMTIYQAMPTGSVPPPGRPGPIPYANITFALQQHPDAIIVNYPSNDTAMGFSAAEQETCYQTLASVAGDANVPIWFATTQPRNMALSLRNVQKALRDWIRMTFGPRSMDFWTDIANPDGTVANAYDSGDGLHLNNAGHAVLYSRVLQAGILEFLLNPTPGSFGNPYGDVDGDGLVNQSDVDIVQAYLATPDSLSAAQQDRVRRYADVSGAVNRSSIGNGVLDANDTQRLALMSGGLIDAGTAGPARADYGDVNGDGHVDIADAVLVQRALNGLVTDPVLLDRVRARGIGDVSPTVPYVSFGDGVVDDTDLTIISARAGGAEAVVPAYVDYWPLHLPDVDHPDVIPDRFTATDINGIVGDAAHHVFYGIQGVEERRGYTVTRVTGSDGSTIAVYKGMDGSLYVLYLEYPLAFGAKRLEFSSPVKLMDAAAAQGQVSSWTGSTTGAFDGTPSQTVISTGTVLDRGDTYSPAAGDFAIGVPRSTWSKSVKVRLDVALLRGVPGTMDMQQAFFYEFAPFIGIVERGQAPIRGMTVEANDRPRMMVNETTVRGISYTQSTP